MLRFCHDFLHGASSDRAIDLDSLCVHVLPPCSSNYWYLRSYSSRTQTSPVADAMNWLACNEISSLTHAYLSYGQISDSHELSKSELPWRSSRFYLLWSPTLLAAGHDFTCCKVQPTFCKVQPPLLQKVQPHLLQDTTLLSAGNYLTELLQDTTSFAVGFYLTTSHIVTTLLQ